MSVDPAPRVTVLMPVYNARPFLREAIDSVLAQTWADFELLIIDDGSDDGSHEIIDQYAAIDPRIRVRQVDHGGLVAALNLGLDLARAELIARADADDVNHPQRLARQVGFLDAHPEVGVCGSGIELIPAGDVWNLPRQSEELQATLLFGVPFYHSTVMLRRDWVERSGCRYDPAFLHAEDYDLWERSASHTRFANLPEPLVRYRCHSGQVSIIHGTVQSAGARSVRERLLSRMLRPTKDQLQLHEEIVAGTCAASEARLSAAGLWLAHLRDANRLSQSYPDTALAAVLLSRWYRTCVLAVMNGLPVTTFGRSPLVAELRNRWWYLLRLRVVSLLGTDSARQVARVWNRVRSGLRRSMRSTIPSDLRQPFGQ